MITIFTGLTGSGKSYVMYEHLEWIIRRNVRWFKKTGILRPVYINGEKCQYFYDKYPDFIKAWHTPDEIIKIRDADVYIEEIAVYANAQDWALMPHSFKAWIQLHRHYGVDIYGNTQDFAMIDKNFRRQVHELYWITKFMGSRSPSPTRPPVTRPWGLIFIRRVPREQYNEDNVEYKLPVFPNSFSILTKKGINRYNTLQDFDMPEFPPLKHVHRTCEDPNCKYHKTVHI